MAKHRRLLALIAAVLSSGGSAAAVSNSNNGRHRTRQQNIHQVRKYDSTRRRLQEEESPSVVDYDWAYDNGGEAGGETGGRRILIEQMSMSPTAPSAKPTSSPTSTIHTESMTMDVAEGKVRQETGNINQLAHVEDDNNKPAIIGGVLGGTMLLLMVMAGVYYARSERRQEKRQFKSSSSSSRKSSSMYQNIPSATSSQSQDKPSDSAAVLSFEHGVDDISTIGDPYIGEGNSINLLEQRADDTVGESMMSSEHQMHVFGVSGRRGHVEGGESTTISGGLTHSVGDDSTMEDVYRSPSGSDASYYRRRESPSTSKVLQLTVVAPAGKLGVVFDDHRTGDMPVVHAIKETSVLHGRVNIGDLLISMDEVDCRNVSAVQVSRLISARSNNPSRVLVLLRCSGAGV